MPNTISIPVAQTGYQDIDGVLWGWVWTANQANGHTLLTFNFPTTSAAYLGYTTIQDFAPLDAPWQAATLKVLALYDAVCNADFVFTTESTAAKISLARASLVDAGTGAITIRSGLGSPPDPNAGSRASFGDAWFNPNYYAKEPLLGGFTYACGLMHEIGHTLGLKHGQDAQDVYGWDGEVLHTNPALAPDHDSLEYSIMTYRAYPGAPTDMINAAEYPSTPMQDDILALQYLCGANYDHDSGNTVYIWSPSTGETFINGVGQGETLNHKIFLTIWDGGGIDTYNFSNYATNAVINLAPGAWSTPSLAQRADLDFKHPGEHMARGCIANAQVFQGDVHGYVENAIGGQASDKIYGNMVNNALSGLAGNDLLVGGPGRDSLAGGLGKDTLIGGSHADRFVFKTITESRAGTARDTIADFRHADGDRIDLHLIDADQRIGHAGNQAFRFIGSESLAHYHQTHPTVVGMIRFDAATHVLQGNVGTNLAADFEVKLAGVHQLTALDFLL